MYEENELKFWLVFIISLPKELVSTNAPPKASSMLPDGQRGEDCFCTQPFLLIKQELDRRYYLFSG